MSDWTLADIRSKTRATTGRPDATMMSNTTLDDYINRYYQFVLPKELKIFWGYTYYQFFTTPDVDQYPGPQTSFQTINPQAWADGWPIDWYISPDTFYQDYPQQLNRAVVATGDGGTSYTFNIPAFPVIPGSVYVTDGTQTAVDDGAGSFVSPASGTIDYQNGAVTVTFGSVVASGTDITVASQTYMPNRPQAILYFPSTPLAGSTSAELSARNMFVLRPVPDSTYLIKMQGIQIPKPLATTTDVPFRADLGPLIAYGASLEIFADFNQMEQYQEAQVQYERYKSICMQDTYEEYLYQRSVPTF